MSKGNISKKTAAKAAIAELDAPAEITVADNTVYYLTDVSDLEIIYPQSAHWQVLIELETASAGTPSVTFPQGTEFIGDEPVFGAGEKWEISIRDGIAVCGKAVNAS